MNGPVLRDIHVPPASWWPPGPGWWVLAGVIVAIALAAAAGWSWHRRSAPLRAALREIDDLAAAFARDGDAMALVDGASRLLRRVALRIDPGAAAHAGARWRGFVHRHARDAAIRHQLDRLADARFRPQPAVDAPALLAALRLWCRGALRERLWYRAWVRSSPTLRPRGVPRGAARAAPIEAAAHASLASAHDGPPAP